MWELDHKESWVLKNWRLQTVVLEKTLENPLDCKEIKPVNFKGNQPWIFIGRIDAEDETPVDWLPDEKSRLTGKDPDAEKDWGQKEKGETEDEMVGWHHWLSGHELSKLQEMVKDRKAWCAAVHGVTKNRIWFSDWTTTVCCNEYIMTFKVWWKLIHLPSWTYLVLHQFLSCPWATSFFWRLCPAPFPAVSKPQKVRICMLCFSLSIHTHLS